MSETDGAGGVAEPSSWRSSRLLPPGLRLVVADLHNHSLHSDGMGDPERAFDQLRAAGLDVAALTDHASIPRSELGRLSLDQYPDARALALGRLAPPSFDEKAWRRTAELADAHDVPGEFTALRGFEWTEPWLGHVNVWFSQSWTPVTTPGSLSGLFEFLDGEPAAVFGYNHPGREPGALADFAIPRAGLPDRMVALEAFNRSDDFLFAGYEDGDTSPIVACLDAGWRPALIGSSDEHGRSYGLVGKGRTGLWVGEHSRDGVREALLARRAFATREAGLRLDATLGRVQFGSTAPGRRLDGSRLNGDLELAVDLAGSGYAGSTVELQLITSARTTAPTPRHGMPLHGVTGAFGSAHFADRGAGPMPVAMPAQRGRALPAGDGDEVVVLHREPAIVGEVTRCAVQIPPGLDWVVLRVADPRRGYGGPAPLTHPCASWALAYSSPWYLRL